ncbi:MAG: hypothetical protein ACI8TQ_001158 [Planctomycetota bacterium]|jgi:hypothetical protein
MKIRHVLSEVLRDNPNWTTVHARADSAPSLDVIAPSTDLRIDGADLPALVLAPPCTVELDTANWPSSAKLELQLGIDSRVLEEHAENLTGHRIELRISIGDKNETAHSVALEQVGRKPGTEWKRANCGLVKSGVVVRLTTALLNSKGEEVAFDSALKVGVGAVELIREEWRPRTQASAENPNIILMVIDTQRADRLSTYGYDRPTSPNLDRMASRGPLFEFSFATSNLDLAIHGFGLDRLASR